MPRLMAIILIFAVALIVAALTVWGSLALWFRLSLPDADGQLALASSSSSVSSL